MEWKKAKGFMILLLIILNLVLLGLNYGRYQENVLTLSQEKAVFEVLSKNGISLYTDLITKFTPMRKITLSLPSYSKEEMKELFFGEEKATTTVEFEKIIIKSDQKILTMRGNKGTLVFPKGTASYPNLSNAQAKEVAKQFMERLEKEIGTFEFGNITKTEGGYVVEYFEKYKGNLVFASNYKIYITNRGITSVDLTFFEPEGYTGDKKEICFSDEALFTFLKEYRKSKKEGAVTITKMELGYDFLEEEEWIVDTSVKLIPCYRIYVMGQEAPYTINAYTNKMLNQKDKVG